MVKELVPGGLLVAFEGIDGCGKTTQALAARDALEKVGFSAVYLREPTDGVHGRKLRQLMVAGREATEPMEEFRLFLADRKEDVENNIGPALQQGTIICLDRYYISSIAYQGALGLDPEFIRRENEKIAYPPDLILYFRMPVEECAERILASRSEGQNLFERRHYQERVFQIFENMSFPQMVRIQALRPVADVHRQVMGEIRKNIALRRTRPALRDLQSS